LYKAKYNGRYYRFEGNDVVCVESDPDIQEMTKRIEALVQKFIDKKVHALLTDHECKGCESDVLRTYLFCPGIGFIDVGCDEGYGLIEHFATISDSGRIICARQGTDDRIIQNIIDRYQTSLSNIEEWINAEVSEEV
jgi:hypothetical protein